MEDKTNTESTNTAVKEIEQDNAVMKAQDVVKEEKQMGEEAKALLVGPDSSVSHTVEDNIKAQSTSTADKENEQGDQVVTLQDIIDEEEQLEEKAKALLGGQDGSVCTYPEGYVPRQTLFACLTCAPEGVNAGVCFGCSLHCHEGHQIVELYTKRRFRCDCGTTKFGDKKCSLYEEKMLPNPSNTYNDNFRGLFCTCKVFFPDSDSNGNMFQCVKCEDWFHLEHCGADFDAEPWKSRKLNDEIGGTLVCATCTPTLRFLQKLQTATEKVCIYHEKEDDTLTGPMVFPDNWRSLICDCFHCRVKFESLNLAYFLNEEDDIEKFAENNLKKAKSDPTEDEALKAFTAAIGRNSTVGVLRGFNEMKRKLSGYLAQKGEGGRAITKEDIDNFFETLKKQRFG